MISSSYALFIIVIIIYIVCLLVLKEKEKENYNKVPRKIWTYIDNPTKISKFSELCIESWRKYNPDYEVIILKKDTYKGYVTIPYDILTNPIFNDSPVRFSELLRLWVLAENGGIWIDATILLKAPLDDWLFPKYGEFSGFYSNSFTINSDWPVIENWFLACNKHSNFMRLWRDEYTEIALFPSIDKYIDNRKKLGVNFQNISDPIGCASLISVQKILQYNKYNLDTLILRKAEDGPIKYLVEANWNSDKGLQLACSNKKYQNPILKLGENEIKNINERIQYDLSNEICEWL